MKSAVSLLFILVIITHWGTSTCAFCSEIKMGNAENMGVGEIKKSLANPRSASPPTPLHCTVVDRRLFHDTTAPLEQQQQKR